MLTTGRNKNTKKELPSNESLLDGGSFLYEVYVKFLDKELTQ